MQSPPPSLILKTTYMVLYTSNPSTQEIKQNYEFSAVPGYAWSLKKACATYDLVSKAVIKPTSK